MRDLHTTAIPALISEVVRALGFRVVVLSGARSGLVPPRPIYAVGCEPRSQNDERMLARKHA